MPIFSPAVKAGAAITVVIVLASVVLDVVDLLGWRWVDMATMALLLTTLLCLLFGVVSISSTPGFAGSKATASEIQARSVSRDGLTEIAGPRGFDWQLLAAAVPPGIAAIIMFAAF